MNKPTLIALIVSAAVGGGVVTFNACTSNRLREQAPPKSAELESSVTNGVPSAEALFLEISDPDHGGRPFELRTRRPVYNLDATVFSQKYGKPGYTLVGNFFYQGLFYIARIPTSDVRGVFFELALIGPKSGPGFYAGQTYLRVQMDQAHPVELVAEMPEKAALKSLQAAPADKAAALLPNENPEADARLVNFVISAEGLIPPTEFNDPFNLGIALRGGYAQALVFQSMEEPLTDLYKSGEPVNEYKLRVTADEGNKLVSEALRVSQALGTSHPTAYKNNCTTGPYEVLRTALGADGARFAYLQKMMAHKIPTAAAKKLSEDGMEGEISLQKDRSLQEESKIAFARVFGGRDKDICKASKVYRGYHCDTIREAVKSLEDWGRLPASVDTDRTSADDVASLKASADELSDLHASEREQQQKPKLDPRGAAAGYESEDVLH